MSKAGKFDHDWGWWVAVQGTKVKKNDVLRAENVIHLYHTSNNMVCWSTWIVLHLISLFDRISDTGRPPFYSTWWYVNGPQIFGLFAGIGSLGSDCWPSWSACRSRCYHLQRMSLAISQSVEYSIASPNGILERSVIFWWPLLMSLILTEFLHLVPFPVVTTNNALTK